MIDVIRNIDAKYIIGIDECGTGSLAGDVYVAAFMAPKEWALAGLDDSKELSKERRQELYDVLHRLAVSSSDFGFSIVWDHPNNVASYKQYGSNLHGLLKSLYLEAASNLIRSFCVSIKDVAIVLDGIIPFPEFPEYLHKPSLIISLPKADSLVPQVSAASVLAKVSRDRYMKALAEIYPNYGWDKNAGYPTKEHKAAIKKYGVCEEHRVSYGPIKKAMESR